MQFPTWCELVLALIGSGLAINALVVDNLGRLGSLRIKRRLIRIGSYVHFRRDASELDNLRQANATVGTFFLTALAIIQVQPVYIALQVLINVSCLGWYLKVHKDVAKSESIKGYFRLAVMVGAWGLLEALELCPGFHRLGVVGLELLGVGLILQKQAALRDMLCFLGGLTLCIYGGIGLYFEPHVFSHLNWCLLNLIYAVLGAIAVWTSFMRTPKEVSPEAGVDTSLEKAV